MPEPVEPAQDTSLRRYRAKRDFARTPEPSPRRGVKRSKPRFVVQKHHARTLHWDVRLEHGGVLWSWAVPKGPSLDPADKRLAVRVEDHPLDYASFHGTIPTGNYGAGTVEIWDEGTWAPLGDPAEALRDGEIKFRLAGTRLNGAFVLVRMRPRRRGGRQEHADNWLLIKEHDADERAGADAEALEATPAPQPRRVPAKAKPAAVKRAETAAPEALPAALDTVAGAAGSIVHAPAAPPAKPRGRGAPAPGAERADLPHKQPPQLATLAEAAPDGAGWISEVKFDGYRLLAWKDGRDVRLVTRNGQDWTARLPDVARAVGKLKPRTLLLDGELVALRPDGLSSFAELQAALANGGDRRRLFFTLFDLLHLDGWDLRPCRLADRKAALHALANWRGALRYSDHLAGEAGRVRHQACAMGLEGIVCKLADAPYRGARGRDWLKVKCQGREEFAVLGWTPPDGSRAGLGALHLGFRDEVNRMHYVGGVGTGFTDEELRGLRRRLSPLASTPPDDLWLAGDPPEPAVRWVRPVLVAEVQFPGWTGFGRLRHGVYLGLRADKDGGDVVRDTLPAPNVERHAWRPRARASGAIVRAAAPGRGDARAVATETVGAVALTHADRELWPGVSKADLARYWQAVAAAALPGIAKRPLALLRCPDGIDGQRFFQKHGAAGLPASIRGEDAAEGPYLALDDEAGLLACAQVAAVELHAWGAPEGDPGRPDRLVFDLDPGEGVPFADVVAAAREVRTRLERLGLTAYARTTGGHGLHVVAPLRPEAGWAAVTRFCKAFAQAMERDAPASYVATLPKARRRGRILVDWLRNKPGATAVASFSPRARPGATVAVPLGWREVGPKLDPRAFTLVSVPRRLARLKADPWDGFEASARPLPTDMP